MKNAKDYVKVKDSNGNTPLHLAAMGGHLRCVEALLPPKSNKISKIRSKKSLKNKQGKTALDMASENNHANCVDYLIRIGREK